MADIMNTIEYLRTTGDTAGSESALPVVGQGVLDRTLLERALPYLRHAQFGQQKSMGRNQGQSMVFRRFESLAQATTPLVDGVTPAGTRLTKTDVVATLKQYGNWTVVTDNVDMFHVNRVMVEASELMGENMGESLDTVVREYLVAGTNVKRVQVDNGGTYALHADRTEVGGVLCKSLADQVIRDLKGAMGKPFQPMISPSDKISTGAVPEAYWWLIHTDQEADLYSTRGGFTVGMHGFIPVQNYANQQGVMKGEVGAYRNVRFVTTTNLKIWAGAGDTTVTGLKNTDPGTGTPQCDVYGTLVFARDAYGVVKPDKAMSKVITHRAGGSSDPLNQRNTVGWKAWITAVILKQDWMVRCEVASMA